MMKNSWLVFAAAVLVLLFFSMTTQVQAADESSRDKAGKLREDGNWAEALEIYRDLLTAEQRFGTGQARAEDVSHAFQCVQRLGRWGEFDDLIEAAVSADAENWRLLKAAAQVYQSVPHQGWVSGEDSFTRDQRNQSGRYVAVVERDRVRALQLYEQALPLVQADQADDQATRNEQVDFFQRFATQLRGSGQSWRLQSLTDLSQLPEFEEANQFGGYRGRGWRPGGSQRGAPVDENGEPVFYDMPESWQAASSDGERWRWLIAQQAVVEPNVADDSQRQWADFLADEFGVQRLAYYPGFNKWLQNYEPAAQDDGEDGPTRFELHTLGEDETLAWLAPGPKRIKLPDEFNFVRIYRDLIAKEGSASSSAADRLAGVFENRRQYPKAAEVYRQAIETIDAGRTETRRGRALAQIVENWARFEPSEMQPVGEVAKVGLVFRNADKVTFKAQRIELKKLLADVRDYIESKPERIDGKQIELRDIGRRLVQGNEAKYIGVTVADWSTDLEPAENHWDRRVDVETPLTDAGPYLLTASLPGGHVCKTVVWLSDTLAVTKKVEKAELYFVGDALTGAPVTGAKVELFGYSQEQIRNTNRYRVITKTWEGVTGDDGLLKAAPKDWQVRNRSMQTLVTISDDEGRFAFDGWRYLGNWFFDGAYSVSGMEQTKCFVTTDRPVYRPEQEVNFKAWTRKVGYELPLDQSEFAKAELRVEIYDPKNEKVFSEKLVADDFGGIDGTLTLEGEATLGVYSVRVGWPSGEHLNQIGTVTFRVEEYKKPEFEVIVDAPDEPMKLGELVTAKVTAKYYFGAPVTSGTVTYSVKRSRHDARWYPSRPWDWLYGEGYWWYAYDYDWYPGWHRWGCIAPIWPWYNWSPDPPEVVVEGEAQLSADGEVTIDIDTAAALAMHGDSDHRYEISVTVTDESRRNIDGSGQVLVAREPFKVFAWVDRGYYRVGDTINADFRAQTLDKKGVSGEGELRLLRLSYDAEGVVSEEQIAAWDLDPEDDGTAEHRLTADTAGQYRLSYKVTDAKGQSIEGGYVFVVRGDGFDGGEKFRFNTLELITDKAEYLPGETLRLMVNTERDDSTVALFVRPSNGVYPTPQMIRMDGKSSVVDVEVLAGDQPNFFIEAFTVSDGKVHHVTREVTVPPQKRVMNVTVTPSKEDYRPGDMATMKVRLTDLDGRPFDGSAVVTIYDKSLEYISGGGNVGPIREFFWNWKRHHWPNFWQVGQNRRFYSLVPPGLPGMRNIGAFGATLADDLRRREARALMAPAPSAPMAMAKSSRAAGGAAPAAEMMAMDSLAEADSAANAVAGSAGPMIEPTLRTDFADSAVWVGSVTTDHDGVAEVSLKMPENLTTWRVKTWAMGHGTVVGEGEVEVITSKNLIIRQQAPRFFVESDEVVLSANVHNYLDEEKEVTVSIELDGDSLGLLRDGDATKRIRIPAGGEQRIDWRVSAVKEGEVAVRMKALTNEESDAVEMSYPVFVHGMLKTESFSGVLRPDEQTAVLEFTVPTERRPEESLLQIRYSPTIAGAMVDALPYLAEFPYGCTEQTLNRFVPTVITQKILTELGIDLKALRREHANLNPQELGEGSERAAQWKRFDRNPVFREGQVDRMVRKGVQRLESMQLSDGGWGWFSGRGEHSSAHTTATVVRGLIVAKANGAVVNENSLQRGVQWLQNYQSAELKKIQNGKPEKKVKPWKTRADATDALVASVLAEVKSFDEPMLTEIFAARADLPVSAKALAGMAFHRKGSIDRRDDLLRNIEQFLQRDEENQTAYLNLPNGGYWWYWYGDEIEAQAHYLKLLVAAQPKSEVASGVVKYLLNNRKHGTYWKSTRDTALCIEAIADYFRASGEDKPDMELEVVVDGEVAKTINIDETNLFTFDDRVTLAGEALTDGGHRVEFRRKGEGPVYFNAYLSNFSLEDFIGKAGLEVKIERRYFKLTPVDRGAEVAGQRGQVVEQKIEAYRRDEIKNGDAVSSGDLVEVELVVESKNDYEYLIIEDLKPAGFEPVDVRSGYDWNGGGWAVGGLRSYREMRDEKVAFFVQQLTRGKHTLSYRTRAEVPGSFSALPAKVEGMYAPELVGNSDELKVTVDD